MYNHNFFVIDNEPTGPNIKLTFPFEVKLDENNNGNVRGFGSAALIQGKAITYTRVLDKGETVFSSGLLGFKPVAEDYNFVIENLKTGAGVRITGDAPIEKLVYWACATTACPEPYIKLSVEPGRTVEWRYSYEFFTGIPAKKS